MAFQNILQLYSNYVRIYFFIKIAFCHLYRCHSFSITFDRLAPRTKSGSFSHSEVSGWTIQLGITRRHAHTYLGQKLKVKRVVPHPNYNLGVAHDNDVALFQVIFLIQIFKWNNLSSKLNSRLKVKQLL